MSLRDIEACLGAQAGNPVCFIMKPKEVKQLAHRGEKEERVSYWLQPKQYDTDKFREAWEIVDSHEVLG